jgi:hypothetical protein
MMLSSRQAGDTVRGMVRIWISARNVNTDRNGIVAEEWNLLWWLVTQTPGWMLTSKQDKFLQGLPIKE